MTESHVHPVDLLPELALGVLPEREAHELRRHLASCPGCEAEYAEMLRVATVLPLAAEDRGPSASVRDSVMDRIRNEPRDVRGRLSRPPRWAAAAAVVVVLVAAGGGYLLGRNGDDSGAAVSEAQFARYTELVRAMVLDDVRRIETATPGGQVVIVSASGSETSYAWVDNFPDLPDGKAYQLWVSRDGSSVEPGEVFSADHTGFWFTTQGPVTGYALLSFTIEDAGGAEQPSQAPFLSLDPRDTARAAVPDP